MVVTRYPMPFPGGDVGLVGLDVRLGADRGPSVLLSPGGPVLQTMRR